MRPRGPLNRATPSSHGPEASDSEKYAEAFKSERLDGVSASELIELLVGEASFIGHRGERILRVREAAIGVRIVRLEADLTHPDEFTVQESDRVVEDAAPDPVSDER